MHSVTLRFPDALTLRFPDSKFVTFVNPHISTNPNVQAQKMEDFGPSYVQAQQKEKLAGNADQAEEDWGSWKGSTGSGSAPAPAPADVASAAGDVGSGAVGDAELADMEAAKAAGALWSLSRSLECFASEFVEPVQWMNADIILWLQLKDAGLLPEEHEADKFREFSELNAVDPIGTIALVQRLIQKAPHTMKPRNYTRHAINEARRKAGLWV
jgi:hypothetical protein